MTQQSKSVVGAAQCGHEVPMYDINPRLDAALTSFIADLVTDVCRKRGEYASNCSRSQEQGKGSRTIRTDDGSIINKTILLPASYI
jgi:hypothetical protein